MLCDNLEGWDGVGGGREAQEGGDICMPVADHVDVWQKPTQYCKAIILQLKIIKIFCFQQFTKSVTPCPSFIHFAIFSIFLLSPPLLFPSF